MLVSLVITPANATFIANNSQQFAATGTLSDGTTSDYTATATWNSSNTSVVSVGSANGSQGLAVMESAGSANITATVGSISGSTGVTVQTPQTPNITGVSPSSGYPGTQVTITGSGFGGSQNKGSVVLGHILAGIVSWSDGTIVASVAPNATSGTVQVLQNGLSSNTVNFTVTLPVVSSISPTSGVAGSQVTITGSGFGASQGSGKVWLGSTYGTVVTWGDTQITAAVAANAASGTAQVLQGGAWSNSLDFSVNTVNIASVTPASGLPGTQVTISGSGFGSSQGNGQMWLGTVPAVVTSWTDAQIQATVAQGSTTGTAQVLQNGVLSNALTFAVNLPEITSVSPGSGAVGASVTISGSGVAWIGSTEGNVVTWSDTQVQATVASTAVSGIVKIQQNGVWSNALGFVVPQNGGTSVTLSPNLISMVVGDTRSLQALDSSGKPVTGLTWTSSDTTLAALSTDDPPIITAVAPGHVTITADNASSDLTIYAGSLPPGTIKWSVPGDSSGVNNFFPAVPSDSGIDLFAQMEDGNIQAITADGEVFWTANIGAPGPNLTFLPDFQDGLTYISSDPSGVTTDSIKRLDGITGQSTTLYSYQSRAGSQARVARVFPDGTVVTFDGDTVFGIDPQTGGEKFSIQLEDSTVSGPSGHCIGDNSTGDGVPSFADFIIAGDGYAYLVYRYSSFKVTPLGAYEMGHSEEHTRVLRVGPNGDSIKIPVNDWTADWNAVYFCPGGDLMSWSETQSGARASQFDDSANVPPGGTGSLMTNADQGVLLPMTLDWGDYFASTLVFIPETTTYPLLSISSSGSVSQIPINLPGGGQNEATLQAEDGTFFGGNNASTIAFDQSGSVKWSVPGDYIPLMALADGGLIAETSSFTSVVLDADGNAIAPLVNGSGAFPSWTGQWYELGSGLSQVSPQQSLAVDCASFWPVIGGNPSGNAAAIPQCPSLLQTTDESTSGSSATSSQTLICPICNLQSPNCVTNAGTQSTFVLIVGDQGLGNHNLGNILNLAAQTEANTLQSQGHRVVACRASSVQDFDSALINHGLIDGGVIYYGHGGPYQLFFGNPPISVGWSTRLAVGENAGGSTNISFFNVNTLANVQTALCSNANDPNCNIIGPNAAILINGCNAAVTIYDEGAEADVSIAQLIANQTKRGVYAFDVGVYFSQQDAADDNHVIGFDIVNGVQVSRTLPNSLPVYPVPVGPPHHKKSPLLFTPQ